MTARNSLRAVQRFEEKLLDFAVHLADVPGIDSPPMMKLGQRDDGLRHRGVASGRTDFAECLLQDAPGGANVPDVTDGYDVIRFENAADKCPFDAFERQAEVRHLRDQIVTLNASEIYERDLVDDPAILQGKAQCIQSGRWQFRTFDAAHQILIGKRVQI